jgi:hypothetical protein
MKNFIKSNYNINVDKIYDKNSNYFFYSGNELVFIIKTNKSEKELDDLVNVSNTLFLKYKKASTFLLNKEGKYYTKYERYYIVLLKYNDIIRDKIEYCDIVNYNINDDLLISYNIINTFKEEIDILERKMQEYNKEYPLVQKSINYYIGMSENAIQLLNNIEITSNSICHNLKLSNYNKVEYNNPFNFIKTNIMYDYANYFKYKFYYETINYDELYYFIRNCDKKSLMIFWGLMLYQKEYFDVVKDILLDKTKEDELNIYINNVNKYKELLIFIKDNCRNINEIKEIEWLDK